MKITKNLSVPAYLFPLAGLAALVAVIVAAVSCTGEGFGMASLPWVWALTLAAAALGCAVAYFSGKNQEHPLASLCALLMVAALGLCVYLMIYGKADVFGTVIFSDLEKGYAPAERASGLGVVSIVCYLAATVLAIVGSFFRLTKKENA